MTIPVEHLPCDIGRCQARELLGVASDADLDACRRAALAHVDQMEYDATDAWHDSVEILFGLDGAPTSTTGASYAALREEAESRLSGQIEVFASRFFAIEPRERVQTWNEFRKRAEISGVLSRRLALLKPGLNLVSPNVKSLGQERESQLMGWILAMFPLRPEPSAAVWIFARDAMRVAPQEWESAAAELARTHPDFVRLGPDLVAAARSWKAETRALARQAKIRRRAARKQKALARRESNSDAGGGRLWWLIPVLVICGLRVMGSFLSKVDFSEKPVQLPRASDFRPFNLSPEILKSMSAVEQEEQRRRLRPQLGTTLMYLLTADAIDRMPETDRADVRRRILAGQKLTAPQAEMLERQLQKLHQEDSLHQFRWFQELARPDEESVPVTAIELPAHDEIPPEADSKGPRPDPPELPEPEGDGGS